MSHSAVRSPAVAGVFYPDTESDIFKELKRMEGEKLPEERSVIAAISPHAGWAYSGKVAASVFSGIKIPDRVILLGPNHRGLGPNASIDAAAAWLFPFGNVPIDSGLAESIAEKAPGLLFHSAPHELEHSLEVIIPFLYSKNRSIRIVPISIFSATMEFIEKLGSAIAECAKESKALIVASSDMTHFLSDKRAREIDGRSIEIVKELDIDKLMKWDREESALCGSVPVAVAICAAKKLGAKHAELSSYSNSGEVTGSGDSVVGYAGFTLG